METKISSFFVDLFSPYFVYMQIAFLKKVSSKERIENSWYALWLHKITLERPWRGLCVNEIFLKRGHQNWSWPAIKKFLKYVAKLGNGNSTQYLPIQGGWVGDCAIKRLWSTVWSQLLILALSNFQNRKKSNCHY